GYATTTPSPARRRPRPRPDARRGSRLLTLLLRLMTLLQRLSQRVGLVAGHRLREVHQRRTAVPAELQGLEHQLRDVRLTRRRGPVQPRPTLPAAPDQSFARQPGQHCHHGGVGEPAITQSGMYRAHTDGFVARPEHLHHRALHFSEPSHIHPFTDRSATNSTTNRRKVCRDQHTYDAEVTSGHGATPYHRPPRTTRQPSVAWCCTMWRLDRQRERLNRMFGRVFDTTTVDRVTGLIRPGLRLVTGEDVAVGRSHLGGLPRLDGTAPWPTHFETPLDLLAVIDVAELGPCDLPGLPAGTRFPNFFFLADRPELLWTSDEPASTWRVVPAGPDAKERTAPVERLVRLARPVGFVPVLT